MCKAPVKSSPSTNRHPAFYRPDALPVAQPTVSEQRRDADIITNGTVFMDHVLHSHWSYDKTCSAVLHANDICTVEPLILVALNFGVQVH